ncbi:MAG TPA: helix-turn-helix domain-containing protein [Marmoricola sp.]|nr:helix-turn-helix domain-containing protein [Marmoricola sp.]
MTQDRRSLILDAAEALFSELGFDATPTARIAADAGVPKGLVFYYFPRKIDLLLALLEERLPTTPSCQIEAVVREGDTAGSLVRLDEELGLDAHESLVLRRIVFREGGTHPEVREYLRNLRHSLVTLTETVLDRTVRQPLDPKLRSQAAQTFVAVMLDRANASRIGSALPDLSGAARVVALAVQPAG